MATSERTEKERLERVGVREFRDRATHYLRLGRPLAIERHGEVVGYYLPVSRPDLEAFNRKLETFEANLGRFLTESGLTEDKLADALDLSRRE